MSRGPAKVTAVDGVPIPLKSQIARAVAAAKEGKVLWNRAFTEYERENVLINNQKRNEKSALWLERKRGTAGDD